MLIYIKELKLLKIRENYEIYLVIIRFLIPLVKLVRDLFYQIQSENTLNKH